MEDPMCTRNTAAEAGTTYELPLLEKLRPEHLRGRGDLLRDLLRMVPASRKTSADAETASDAGPEPDPKSEDLRRRGDCP